MATSIGRQQGYLVIDHSASPGIPENLAAQWRKRGAAVAAGSVKLELDTYTCSHCQAVVLKNTERTRDREVCRNCMHVVCDRCSVPGFCTPFAEIADQVANGQLLLDEHTQLLIPRRA